MFPLRLVLAFCLLASAALAQQDLTKPVAVRAPEPLGRQNLFSGVAIPSDNLLVGPGDLVAITVFDIPELGTESRVSNSGELDYPLLGSVKLLGKTASEASSLIAAGLRDGGYVREPRVSVSIREYATQGIAVTGEVHSPGTFPLIGTHTLLDCLSAAGGLTSFASHTITITHTGSVEPSVYTIDTRPAQSWKTNPVVKPGDRIEVARAGLVYVIGDVARPGGFVMENGEPLTVLRAMALAGGGNRTARLSKARIVRKTETGVEETHVPVKALLAGKMPDIELHSDDVLYIPGSEAETIAVRTAQSLLNAVAYSAIYAAR